jgi:hypothetical protein
MSTFASAEEPEEQNPSDSAAARPEGCLNPGPLVQKKVARRATDKKQHRMVFCECRLMEDSVKDVRLQPLIQKKPE